MKKFADIAPMQASTLLNELEQATRQERGMRPGNSLRDHLAKVVFRRFTVQEVPAPTPYPMERLQECVRRLDEERVFAAAPHAPWSAQAQVTVHVMKQLLGLPTETVPQEPSAAGQVLALPPTDGDNTPYPMNVYLRDETELRAFLKRFVGPTNGS